MSLLGGEQHPADAGAVHFDAQIVPVRMSCRERRQILAVAEADFGDPQGTAAEGCRQVQRFRLEFDAVLWPQHLQGPLLCLRDAAGARHERPHGAGMFVLGHGVQAVAVSMAIKAGAQARAQAGAMPQTARALLQRPPRAHIDADDRQSQRLPLCDSTRHMGPRLPAGHALARGGQRASAGRAMEHNAA